MAQKKGSSKALTKSPQNEGFDFENMLKSSHLDTTLVSAAKDHKADGQLHSLFIECASASLARKTSSNLASPVEFSSNLAKGIISSLSCECGGFIISAEQQPFAQMLIGDGKGSISEAAYQKVIKELKQATGMDYSFALQIHGQTGGENQQEISDLIVEEVKVSPSIQAYIFAAKTDDSKFEHTEKSFLSRLSYFLAPVINSFVHIGELAHLRKKNQAYASIDPTTNLYNLEFLIGFLQQQLLFSFRQKSPVSAVMLDIDNFKGLSEELGFELSERLLANIASKLVNQGRGSDLVARYGIDEFTIILPNTDLHGSTIVAEKLRLEIENSDLLQLGPGKSVKVTVSAGCSTFNMKDLNPESILLNAKLALQRAKSGGRNRVCV